MMPRKVSPPAADELDPSAEKEYRVLGIPARFLFAILGCLGFLSVYTLRCSMSVVMVAMVTVTSRTELRGSDECAAIENKANSTLSKQKEIEGEFAWDEKTQGLIFGAFFWGYFLLPLPAGRLADRFGGKWLFGGGILFSGLFALLTPTAARLGVGWFIAIRFISGLAEGVLLPAMQSMMTLVALPPEKSKMCTFVYAGAQGGALVGMPVAGLLCDWGVDGGWPLVFYCFGSASIIWFIPWAYFVYGNHPCHKLNGNSRTRMAPKFPWKKALTSLPVWAIIISHFCNEWVYYTLISQMPMYMKSMLQFDIKQNSLFSALPYLGRWIFGVTGSCVADFVFNSKMASRTTIVKVANFIGLAFPGVLLVGITFIGCDQLWNVVVLTSAIAVGGVMYAGYFCNHMDIAPRYSGTLFAISTTVATTTGVISPYVAGALINNRQTLHQWHVVFYIAAGISFFAAITYCLFASGEEQPWNGFADEVNSETTRLNRSHVFVNSKKAIKTNVELLSVTANRTDIDRVK